MDNKILPLKTYPYPHRKDIDGFAFYQYDFDGICLKKIEVLYFEQFSNYTPILFDEKNFIVVFWLYEKRIDRRYESASNTLFLRDRREGVFYVYDVKKREIREALREKVDLKDYCSFYAFEYPFVLLERELLKETNKNRRVWVFDISQNKVVVEKKVNDDFGFFEFFIHGEGVAFWENKEEPESESHYLKLYSLKEFKELSVFKVENGIEDLDICKNKITMVYKDFSETRIVKDNYFSSPLRIPGKTEERILFEKYRKEPWRNFWILNDEKMLINVAPF